MFIGEKVGLSGVGVRSEKVGDVGEVGDFDFAGEDGESDEVSDSCGVIVLVASGVDDVTGVF